MLAHLVAEQLDSVMDREEVARHIVDSAEYFIPIRCKEVVLDCGYRADLLVDECILVENKIADVFHPVHRAQLLAYIKLSGRSIDFPINWKVPRFKDGHQRMIWNERQPRNPQKNFLRGLRGLGGLILLDNFIQNYLSNPAFVFVYLPWPA